MKIPHFPKVQKWIYDLTANKYEIRTIFLKLHLFINMSYVDFIHFYVFSILIDAYKILASADRYNTNNVCVIDELRIEGVVGKIEEDELV